MAAPLNICNDCFGVGMHYIGCPAGEVAAPAETQKVPVQFAAVGTGVMQGGECVATARSATMAQRIARALNEHQPNKRGV